MRCCFIALALVAVAARRPEYAPGYVFGSVGAPTYNDDVQFETPQKPTMAAVVVDANKPTFSVQSVDQTSISLGRCPAGCRVWALADGCNTCMCDGAGNTLHCTNNNCPMLAQKQTSTGHCLTWITPPQPCQQVDCPTNHLGECICEENELVWSPKTCKCENPCENGNTDVPAACNAPIDIAFVIDASGSIGNNYVSLKNEVSKIVEGMDISPTKVHVSARAFSCSTCHAQTGAGFNFQDQIYGDGLVMQTINNLPFHGQSTYIGNAVKYAWETTFNSGVATPNGYRGSAADAAAMIIVTDGRPTGASQGTMAQSAAASARAAGIKVYAIGVGGYGSTGTDWGALSNMACGPGVQPQQCNNVFQSANFDVSQFKQQLLEGLCDSGSSGSGSSGSGSSGSGSSGSGSSGSGSSGSGSSGSGGRVY